MAIIDDRIYGIDYSLNQLLGWSVSDTSGSATPVTDRSRPDSDTTRRHESTAQPSTLRSSKEAHCKKPLRTTRLFPAKMGVRPLLIERKCSASRTSVKPGIAFYFVVIYTAPGDYHRFYSPTAWTVVKRRYVPLPINVSTVLISPGELFSVSPWMAKRLQILFVLNERVAIIGRWRYGFFSMISVCATNIGNIKINFDTVRVLPQPYFSFLHS